jgi:hypothetical protein
MVLRKVNDLYPGLVCTPQDDFGSSYCSVREGSEIKICMMVVQVALPDKVEFLTRQMS